MSGMVSLHDLTFVTCRMIAQGLNVSASELCRPFAVELAFAGSVDYATVIKEYASTPGILR